MPVVEAQSVLVVGEMGESLTPFGAGLPIGRERWRDSPFVSWSPGPDIPRGHHFLLRRHRSRRGRRG